MQQQANENRKRKAETNILRTNKQEVTRNAIFYYLWAIVKMQLKWSWIFWIKFGCGLVSLPLLLLTFHYPQMVCIRKLYLVIALDFGFYTILELFNYLTFHKSIIYWTLSNIVHAFRIHAEPAYFENFN